MTFSKRIGETQHEAFIEEACQRLTQIGVEPVPIMRDSSHYIGGEPGMDVISNLGINLENLDAVQLYSWRESVGGMGSARTIGYYCIDYLLRADIRRFKQEIRRLEAYAKHEWRGSILKFSGRELQDLKWIAGRSGLISLFKRLFRAGLNSRLTNALNRDIALKDSLVQQFRNPWKVSGRGQLAINVEVSFQGIEIAADVANSCVRIKIPRETPNKEDLLDVLASRQLVQALDRIAYHVQREMVQLESSSRNVSG